MSHSVQDGRDAAARARAGGWSRPRPIRYDLDIWLVMRNDPVLPAAIIVRIRGPKPQEFFITILWDLDHTKRRMVGRYCSLEDADSALPYKVRDQIVARPSDDVESLRARQEEHALQLEQERAARENLYGP